MSVSTAPHPRCDEVTYRLEHEAMPGLPASPAMVARLCDGDYASSRVAVGLRVRHAFVIAPDGAAERRSA